MPHTIGQIGVHSDVEMTAQEVEDFNLEHARKFHEGDFAGNMGHSIIDEAVWEFYPNRIRASGKEALLRYHELNYNVVIKQAQWRGSRWRSAPN